HSCPHRASIAERRATERYGGDIQCDGRSRRQRKALLRGGVDSAVLSLNIPSVARDRYRLKHSLGRRFPRLSWHTHDRGNRIPSLRSGFQKKLRSRSKSSEVTILLSSSLSFPPSSASLPPRLTRRSARLS